MTAPTRPDAAGPRGLRAVACHILHPRALRWGYSLDGLRSALYCDRCDVSVYEPTP